MNQDISLTTQKFDLSFTSNKELIKYGEFYNEQEFADAVGAEIWLIRFWEKLGAPVNLGVVAFNEFRMQTTNQNYTSSFKKTDPILRKGSRKIFKNCYGEYKTQKHFADAVGVNVSNVIHWHKRGAPVHQGVDAFNNFRTANSNRFFSREFPKGVHKSKGILNGSFKMQKEIAKEFGVSDSHISVWKGRGAPIFEGVDAFNEFKAKILTSKICFKSATQKEIAKEFNVTQPNVATWMKRGAPVDRGADAFHAFKTDNNKRFFFSKEYPRGILKKHLAQKLSKKSKKVA